MFNKTILIILEQPSRQLTVLKPCKCSQILYPSLWVASIPNRTKTNHYWFDNLQLLQTHTHTHRVNYSTQLCKLPEGKFSNPWGNTGKSWTHSTTSFLWVTPESKRWCSPRILSLFSYIRNKKMNLSTGEISLTRVTNTNSRAVTLLIKIGWWDAFLTLWDLAEAISTLNLHS